MIKKITRKKLEPFLSRHATKQRVLDIGSGGSSYDRFFPNRVTVDIDPARKPDIVADAHQLPFGNNEFQVLLSTEMLEHVRDPFQVEREMRRVTAPGGVLILSTRFVFPIHDAPHDYWRFTKYGLQELFREWDLVELVSETENFSTVGALLQRIAFQTKLKGGRLSTAVLLLLAWVTSTFDWLTNKEFGDIGRTVVERELMPTGYYMVCRKRT